MVLALSHKRGRGSDIYSPQGLIAKLRVLDYQTGKFAKIYFETLDREGEVIDRIEYCLEKDRPVNIFSELRGFNNHKEELELFIGEEHYWPGICIGYKAPKSLKIIRTDAKKKY